MDWVVRTAGTAACVLCFALLGCRKERPDVGPDPTAEKNGTTEQPDNPDKPQPPKQSPFPDEPSPGARAKLEKPGRLVITVHPQGMTWIDGQLLPPAALIKRIQEESAKGDLQPEVMLFYPKANEMPLSRFQEFERMMRAFNLREVRHVWGGPGWEGLGPADDGGGPDAPAKKAQPLLPLPPTPGGNR